MVAAYSAGFASIYLESAPSMSTIIVINENKGVTYPFRQLNKKGRRLMRSVATLPPELGWH